MSLFEFLMVMISIIVGLGISEVLTGVARFIRSRDSTQGYWVHSVLVTVIFVALLQQWWEIWGLRDVTEWDFVGVLMMLSGPVGLFLIAHLIFPEPVQGAELREYYHGRMRPVWWLAAATVVFATAFRPLVMGSELFSPDNATSFVALALFVVLGISRQKIVHAVFVPLLLLIMLLDVTRWSFVASAN